MRTFVTAGMLFLPLAALAGEPSDSEQDPGAALDERLELALGVGSMVNGWAWQPMADVGIVAHVTPRLAVEARGFLAGDLGQGGWRRTLDGAVNHAFASPDETLVERGAVGRVVVTPLTGSMVVARRTVGVGVFGALSLGGLQTWDVNATIQCDGRIPCFVPEDRQRHTVFGGGTGLRAHGERWTLRAELEHLTWREDFASISDVRTGRTTVRVGAGVLFGREQR